MVISSQHSGTIHILKGKKLIIQTEKEKKLGLAVVFIFTLQVQISSFCSLPQMAPFKVWVIFAKTGFWGPFWTEVNICQPFSGDTQS